MPNGFVGRSFARGDSGNLQEKSTRATHKETDQGITWGKSTKGILKNTYHKLGHFWGQLFCIMGLPVAVLRGVTTEICKINPQGLPTRKPIR